MYNQTKRYKGKLSFCNEIKLNVPCFAMPNSLNSKTHYVCTEIYQLAIPIFHYLRNLYNLPINDSIQLLFKYLQCKKLINSSLMIQQLETRLTHETHSWNLTRELHAILNQIVSCIHRPTYYDVTCLFYYAREWRI